MSNPTKFCADCIHCDPGSGLICLRPAEERYDTFDIVSGKRNHAYCSTDRMSNIFAMGMLGALWKECGIKGRYWKKKT